MDHRQIKQLAELALNTTNIIQSSDIASLYRCTSVTLHHNCRSAGGITDFDASAIRAELQIPLSGA